jgi:hypothetical protein
MRQVQAVDRHAQSLGINRDAVGMTGHTAQADACFHLDVVLEVGPARDENRVASGSRIDAGLDGRALSWDRPCSSLSDRGGSQQQDDCGRGQGE